MVGGKREKSPVRRASFTTPVSASANIPSETRHRIYQEVLVLEGQGVTHERSVTRVASEREISEQAVEEISWEGVSRGWALP